MSGTWMGISLLAALALPLLLPGLAASAPPDPSLTVVITSGESQSVDCVPGMHIQVHGSGNTVQLFGHCDALTVLGADNQISAEAVAHIRLTGAHNHVHYKSGIEGGASSGKPEIQDKGRGNEVTQDE